MLLREYDTNSSLMERNNEIRGDSLSAALDIHLLILGQFLRAERYIETNRKRFEYN